MRASRLVLDVSRKFSHEICSHVFVSSTYDGSSGEVSDPGKYESTK